MEPSHAAMHVEVQSLSCISGTCHLVVYGTTSIRETLTNSGGHREVKHIPKGLWVSRNEAQRQRELSAR